ncbi:uncharacterized protein BDZ99DRAFT_307685 [Mytilinidion resinicola]|uniref:Uncharacterized protein n=1 Tax=Mytilinidion resinicola TaxID=574789 RepID=A0A6A6YMW2_9PEZI|nr:uncharacterized protein BDZ99DRAFT_307685 [Mytilinidion resinicola]KAF2810226.1 hypothetical protein BDZ99DRAFT_307685 [Mytilinidion resinicola]
MSHVGYVVTFPDWDAYWMSAAQVPKQLDESSQRQTFPIYPAFVAKELPSIKDIIYNQSNATPHSHPLLSSPLPIAVTPSLPLPHLLEHMHAREPPLQPWHVTSDPSRPIQSRQSRQSPFMESIPEEPMNLLWDQLTQPRKVRRTQYIQCIWKALGGKKLTDVLPLSMWPTTFRSANRTPVYYDSQQPDDNVRNWNDLLLWLLAMLFDDNAGRDLKAIVDTLQEEMVTRLCSQAKEEGHCGLQPQDVERVIRRFRQPLVQPRSNTDEAMVRRFQSGAMFA